LPIRMKDAGVDTETDAISLLLAEAGGVDSLVEVSGIQFVLPDCFAAVDAPGNYCLVIRFEGKEVVDIRAFCEQHQKRRVESREERDKCGCQVCDMVEGERIEHFAHIEADFAQAAIGEFGDLPEHRVVVDIDFYEGVIFAIDERKIAICAAIRAAVGNGNELVIGATANMGAKFAVESVDERRGLANHEGSLTFNNCLAGSDIREISLMAYDFDLCGGKELNDSLCLGVNSDFPPK